jgi:hypothetical protein
LSLGITEENIIVIEKRSQNPEKYDLWTLKRWAAESNKIWFDFGNQYPGTLSFFTHEAQNISEILSGYISIIRFVL